jgi:predicted Zn-ribbon and HTH transcriptional regulator
VAKRLGDEEWKIRASNLGLEWVDRPPRRNDIPTLIRCLTCGKTWPIQPAGLAKGGGCDACHRKSTRVGHEEWLVRIQALNATWVSGTPETLADTSKAARCLLCGETWIVNPRKLYGHYGHPRCKEKSKTPAISFAEWQRRAKKVDVEWLSEPPNSKVPTPARCLQCGHNWSPTPSNVSGGSRCPKCALVKIPGSSGSVTISEWKRRAIVAGVEWYPEPPAKSSAKTQVRCLKCSHVWVVLPSNISKGHGCPSCAGNAPINQSEWDIRAANAGLEWLDEVKGRHQKATARCLQCKFTWKVDAGQVAQGAGCPECGAKKAQKSRSISEDVWKERAKNRNLEWLETPHNNSTKRRIRCLKCGHEWKVTPQNVSSRSGCPQCAGTVVSEDTWNKRASSVGIRWMTTPNDSRKPTPAKCLTCKLEWNATPDSVGRGSGCPNCAVTGYKMGEPGIFYFIERDNRKGRAARKIGISNTKSFPVRLAFWKSQGFRLIFQVEDQDGAIIQSLEKNMLSWLRDEIGLGQYLDKEEMPRGGSSETFAPDNPSNQEILNVISGKLDDLRGT